MRSLNPVAFRGGMESVGRSSISLLTAAAVALATPRLRRALLHHCLGVFPHAAVHQPVGFDRLLAGLNAAGADRDLDHGFELLLVHAVVVGGPEADVEELLERKLVDLLAVAGRRGVIGDAIAILRIL